MKNVFFAALITFVLISPAIAQLGPAGVPGAPGLAPEPTPVTQPSPETKNPKNASVIKRTPTACAGIKDTERCVLRQELHKEAKEACKKRQGKMRQKCIDDYVNRHLK